MTSAAWLDPVVDGCGFGRYQVQVLLQCGGIYFASAAFFVVLGSALKHLPAQNWDMSEVEAGFLQSGIFVGMLFGSLFGGIASDRYGRRVCVLVTYLLILVASSLMIMAWGYEAMLLGCVLFGGAGGFGLPALNALLVESTPSRYRGDLVCAASLLWFFGELYGASCVWFLQAVDLSLPGAPKGRLHWRACLALSIAPVVPVICHALLFLKESPRFLASKGRTQEAEQCVVAMAKANGRPDPSTDFPKQSEPESEISLKPAATTSLTDALQVLSRWPIRESTLCLMIQCIVCNFAYYGLIFALPQVLSRQPAVAGHGAWHSGSAQVFIVTLFKVPGIVLALFLLRAQGFGHKIPLGLLFVTVAAAAWSYPKLVQNGAMMSALGAACMLKLATSTIFVIVYVFALEVYPTKVRSTGLALCTMIGRLGSIASGPVYILTTSYNGTEAYFLVIAICALAAGAAAMTMPMDTKGAPLAEGETEMSEKTALVSSKSV